MKFWRFFKPYLGQQGEGGWSKTGLASYELNVYSIGELIQRPNANIP